MPSLTATGAKPDSTVQGEEAVDRCPIRVACGVQVVARAGRTARLVNTRVARAADAYLKE
jgi:hypothetical protein